MFDKTVGVKKPAGTAGEIEMQFQCESSRLVMVYGTQKCFSPVNLFFMLLE